MRWARAESGLFGKGPVQIGAGAGQRSHCSHIGTQGCAENGEGRPHLRQVARATKYRRAIKRQALADR